MVSIPVDSGMTEGSRPSVEVPDPAAMMLAGLRNMKVGFEAMASGIRSEGIGYSTDIERISKSLGEIEARCRKQAAVNGTLKTAGEGIRLLTSTAGAAPPGAAELGEKIAREMEAAVRLGDYFSKLADAAKQLREELEQVRVEDQDTVLQLVEDMGRLYRLFEEALGG
jgi:hypothetical protein